jgi:hypothetical protein
VSTLADHRDIVLVALEVDKVTTLILDDLVVLDAAIELGR